MKRILVVDDSATSRKLALFVLKNLGCDAEGAESASDALEALRRERYDAVFMDINMPDMDGCEAASLIRSGELGSLNENTPIIAITGSDIPEERVRCAASGMTDFLGKPFSGEKAEEILNRYCP